MVCISRWDFIQNDAKKKKVVYCQCAFNNDVFITPTKEMATLTHIAENEKHTQFNTPHSNSTFSQTFPRWLKSTAKYYCHNDWYEEKQEIKTLQEEKFW
jgi:hypothetical protein